MSSAAALKHYFGVELAELLANLITPYHSGFPARTFIASIADRTGPLELKDRVAAIADELRKALPSDYADALGILLNILGAENETEEGMFTNGYFLMPVAFFVEKYGLEHFDLSMQALYEITKRHTSEYAVRPYLDLYTDECLSLLRRWSHDANVHVRRLVSEGTRPRLPWAKRIDAIKGDPDINLSLLEPLIDDPSFYVRKSAANHVNDLTKDYKEATLNWLAGQIARGGSRDPWFVRHAVRSLIKSDDQAALELLKK